jgi:hypothetical protein
MYVYYILSASVSLTSNSPALVMCGRQYTRGRDGWRQGWPRAGAYIKGWPIQWPWTPSSFARARHALPFYAVRAACDRLPPPWTVDTPRRATPHAVVLWLREFRSFDFISELINGVAAECNAQCNAECNFNVLLLSFTTNCGISSVIIEKMNNDNNNIS